MEHEKDKDEYGVSFNEDVTGKHENYEDYKIIVYPFDKYEIKVKLSMDNKFLGVIEVKLSKDFLSFKQKMISKGVHDVDKFYRE